MSAAIYRMLHAAGLTARAEAGVLVIAPVERLTDELRANIRDNKAELLAYLAFAPAATEQLLIVAMRACEKHGDGPTAREAMRQDCLATPPHLLADLLYHFHTTYPIKDSA